MAVVHKIVGPKVQFYRRANSPFWWCSTTVGGERRRTSTKKESLSEATAFGEDWALNLKGVERWGGGVKKAEKTFRMAAERFLNEYEIITQGERSPQYVKNHHGRVTNHLIPFFGDMPLTEITSGAIQDYRVHRLKTGPLPRGPKSKEEKPVVESEEKKPVKRLGRSTLHQEIVCLRQILKAANRLGWLPNLPDMSAPYKFSGKAEHRAWFSPTEYKTLFTTTRDHSENPRDEDRRGGYEELHDCVLFLGNSGLRPDEALSLEFRDVSAETDEGSGQRILAIEVRGKRGYGPCKTMPGAVLPFRRIVTRRTAAFRAQRKKAGDPNWEKAQLDPTERVFPALQRALFNGILIKLGMKADRDGRPRTFYSLRHTYICLRLLDGANAYELAKNCRTSVEMIQDHYAVHLKNYIDASLVNVRKKKKTPKNSKGDTEEAKPKRRRASKSPLATTGSPTIAKGGLGGRGGTGRRNGLRPT
jgi:integrase